MFDLDAGKLIVIGVIALVVIGPKELPRVLRQVGQATGKLRRMAAEFQGQFMDAMREADVENLKKEMASVTDAAKIDINFDPAREIGDSVTQAIDGTKPVEASVAPSADPDAPAASVANLPLTPADLGLPPVAPAEAPDLAEAVKMPVMAPAPAETAAAEAAVPEAPPERKRKTRSLSEA